MNRARGLSPAYAICKVSMFFALTALWAGCAPEHEGDEVFYEVSASERAFSQTEYKIDLGRITKAGDSWQVTGKAYVSHRQECVHLLHRLLWGIYQEPQEEHILIDIKEEGLQDRVRIGGPTVLYKQKRVRHTVLDIEMSLDIGGVSREAREFYGVVSVT